MRNRHILHIRQEAEIYKDYYRPSFNLLRFFRSIAGILVFGSNSVAHGSDTVKTKLLK